MGYAKQRANGYLLLLSCVQRFRTTEVCVGMGRIQRTPHLQIQRLVIHRGCSTPVRLRNCVVCRLVASRQKKCLSMSLLEEVVS